MCGIFAYSGFQSAKPNSANLQSAQNILLEGLKKLEYRGYDSSGMVFFTEDSIKRFRVCGDVSELEKQLKNKSYKSHLGMGHTRWATHGAPSTENAHPHQASSIYVVHNGVIENEEELKKNIDPKLLTSETDTEIIAHTIFNFYKESKDFLQSVLKTTRCLKGSYSVVVMCADKPNEMIAFKKGPPLVFCRGEGAHFLSSDPYVAAEQANQALFLDDQEMIHLKNNEFEIYNFKGEKIQKEFEALSYNPEFTDKKGYPHFMLKEIFEQAPAISRCLAPHINKGKQQLNLKLSKGNQKDFDLFLKDVSQILIVACGSSYYAGLFAKYLIESLLDIQVNVEMASELIYRKSFISKDTAVLFISQSGETADILTALNQIVEKGFTSISLCNVEGSSLTRKTKYALSIEAGKEVGVASTKTFSNSLVMLMLLGFYIAKLKKQLEPTKETEIMKQLLALPVHIEEVLKYKQTFLDITKDLKKFSGFFYLGRGAYYSIALEGALKLKEIAYLHAEAYPAGEMKHGPLALIDKNMLVIFLLPQKGVLYEKTITNLKEAKARGANVMAIGNCNNKEVEKLCLHYLPLPDVHKFLHPLLSLIPLQLMAYCISTSYGYNPDRPKNLAKSVTVE